MFMLRVLLSIIGAFVALVSFMLFPFVAGFIIVALPVLVLSAILAVPVMFTVGGTMNCFTKDGRKKFWNWMGFAFLLFIVAEIALAI